MEIVNILRFITNHPLNAHQKLKAVLRFVTWQVASRLLPGSVVVNYVNKARLIVNRGMTGATGNVYTGLHEFEDMAFVLHSLRAGDLFIDIGANVGSYTVLAGAVAGAKCLAFEPAPLTFSHLVDNININRISDIVTAYNMGIGRGPDTLKFTIGLDTVNHVLGANEMINPEGFMEIPVDKLDNLVGTEKPILIKIDVEGFETEVIAGAHNTLSQPTLLAVIMELNGSGDRYGYDETEIHKKMLSYGFKSYSYSPYARALSSIDSKNQRSGNTLYVKNVNAVQVRLQTAPQFETNNCKI